VDVAERNQIIAELYDCYMANGFITEDEALSLFSAHKTPLHQIDSITEQILAMGVIISADDDDAEQLIDRSRSDFHTIFNEFVELAPESSSFIEYIRNIAPPQHREWKKLIPQAQSGNEYAKNRLIEMYMRISVRQALYFSKKYRLPLEDTLQDALIGAITSVDKFNSANHMNYSTYLPWWISQSISRNRSLYSNPMYYPVHIKDKLFSIMIEVEEHICEHCPSNEDDLCFQLIKEISKKNEWPPDEVARNIYYLSEWKSLDKMMENEEDISDNGVFAEELSNEAIRSNSETILFELMETFKPRQKGVLMLRHGFTNKGALTLEEIGKILGITRERVRQLEAKALERLRRSSKIQCLQGE